MQGRGEIIETVPLLPDGADPTPRGPAATVSGQGAQECLSSRVLHTVGTQSICRGHAKVCSWAWREPCPAGVPSLALSPWWLHCSNSSRFGMSLFTISVNLIQRTSSSERPAGVCQGARGVSDGSRPPSRFTMSETPSEARGHSGRWNGVTRWVSGPRSSPPGLPALSPHPFI